ncbi:DUF6881 domain-containing protein [Nocardia brasiliensis]
MAQTIGRHDLAGIPIAPVEEIASQPEFDAVEIPQDEFEREWAQAR